jgi:hypothetical protein
MKEDLDTVVVVVRKAGGVAGRRSERRLLAEVAAKNTAEGLFGLLGDLGDGRVGGALWEMCRSSRSDRRGGSSGAGWGKRQELIGLAVECQQVEGAEVVAGGVKLGDTEANELCESLIGPEADPAAVGGESKAEVEQLGWAIHPLQEAGGQQPTRKPAEGTLDRSKALRTKQIA